ncbi:conserved protein of unknown function [Candidatus Hydrogenisulfobacillus filiaventi]|uniref:DUF2249 domain-containing protein n=1 Tax=Candidatus Hydrogenisulfobacillus filiaventi TaxID=2707344 RepID=A0A6F8ZF06_9FIRM|nr:DUF2249 domain-containing protein [Bacillota bacterium]CAB1128179.1 conserved protein of unknown function [Candidatus Hydrogenisulfobacillus filiaventi]
MAPKRLDVRDDLREGREPFQRIMDFVDGLEPGESWELLATFRPDPLIRVMSRRGYRHAAEEWDDGTWCITFLAEAAAEGGQEA